MESNQIPDEQLVRGVLAGDPHFHSYLQEKYAGKLLYIIHNIVRDQADAEEILNDVLYRIILDIDTYVQTKASFKTWIYRIAINCSIDFLRTHKQPIQINQDVNVERLPIRYTETENSEMLTPQIGILQGVLEQMKERDRTLLEMRYGVRLTNEEIANYLKLNSSTVRVALHRARNRLKSKLITYPEFKSYTRDKNKRSENLRED